MSFSAGGGINRPVGQRAQLINHQVVIPRKLDRKNKLT